MRARGGGAQAGALQQRKGTCEVRGLDLCRAAGTLAHPPRETERDGDHCSATDKFVGRERKVFATLQCKQMAPERCCRSHWRYTLAPGSKACSQASHVLAKVAGTLRSGDWDHTEMGKHHRTVS